MVNSKTGQSKDEENVEHSILTLIYINITGYTTERSHHQLVVSHTVMYSKQVEFTERRKYLSPSSIPDRGV